MSNPLRLLVAAALLIAPLLALPAVREGVHQPRNTLLAVVGFAVLAAAVPRLPNVWNEARRPERGLIVSGVALAALLFLGGMLSASPAQSWNGTGTRFVGVALIAGSIGLMLGLPAVLRRTDGAEALFLSLGTAVTAVGVYVVLQRSGLDPFSDRAIGRPGGTLGNPNFASAFLGLGPPLGVAALMARRDAWRWLGLLPIVVGLVGHHLTGSRVGWATLATGIVVVFLVYFRTPWERQQGWLIAALPVGSALAGLAVVAAAARLGDPNSIARVGYWRTSWRMWRDNLPLGVGPGRYVEYFREFRDPQTATIAGVDTTTSSTHAWFFDLLPAGGPLAAVLSLVVLGFAGAVLRRRWLSGASSQSFVLIATTSLLSAHAMQSSISVPIGVMVWIGFLLLGVVLALGTEVSAVGRNASKTERRRHAQTLEATPLRDVALATVAVALLAVPLGRPLLVSQDLTSSAAHLRAGEVDAALEAAGRATERAPWWPATWFAQVTIAEALNDVEVLELLLLEAYNIDGHNLGAASGLAQLTAALGRTQEADDWYGRMLELDPYGPSVRFAVARWQLDTDRPREALDTLELLEPYLEPSMRNYPRYESLREEAQEAL